MSRFTTLLCLLAACVVPATLSAAPESAPGLSPAATEAFERFISVTEALEPVLAGVTDKATADAAAPKLHEQLTSVYQAREALKNVVSLSEAEQRQVEQSYARRMREDWARVYAHMFRLQKEQCYHSSAFTQEFGNLNMMLAQ